MLLQMFFQIFSLCSKYALEYAFYTLEYAIVILQVFLGLFTHIFILGLRIWKFLVFMSLDQVKRPKSIINKCSVE